MVKMSAQDAAHRPGRPLGTAPPPEVRYGSDLEGKPAGPRPDPPHRLLAWPHQHRPVVGKTAQQGVLSAVKQQCSDPTSPRTCPGSPGSAPGPAPHDLLVLAWESPSRRRAIGHRKKRGSNHGKATTEFSLTEGDPALRPRGSRRRLESWLRRGRRGGHRMIVLFQLLFSKSLFEVRFSSVQIRVSASGSNQRLPSQYSRGSLPGAVGLGSANRWARGIGSSQRASSSQPPAASSKRSPPAETGHAKPAWFPRPSDPSSAETGAKQAPGAHWPRHGRSSKAGQAVATRPPVAGSTIAIGRQSPAAAAGRRDRCGPPVMQDPAASSSTAAPPPWRARCPSLPV